MSRTKIIAICAGIALLHFVVTLGATTAGVFPSPNAEPSSLLAALWRFGDLLLQPAAALWEPTAESSLALGLAIIFANSLLWAVVLTAFVVLFSRIKGRKRAAF